MSEKLQKYIDILNKTHGENTVIRLDESSPIEEVILTGSIGLNEALSGGLPRGRIIELFGPESSGKSTLSIHIMVEAQKFGTVVLIDVEHAFDASYAVKLGLKLEDLLVSQPRDAQMAMDVIESLVASDLMSLIVIDSVAGLVPTQELEGDPGDANMGLMARLMGQHLRKMIGVTARTKCIVLYLNQLRQKLGVFGFGPKETTPAGNALKYFSSVRLDIRRIQTLKDKSGIRSRVKVVKNKTAMPFKEAEFCIRFGKGIAQAEELIEIAIEKKVVGKSGGWYSFNDNRIGQGKENAIIYIEENNLFDEIYKKCML